MFSLECERCGSSNGVSTFVHFEPVWNEERLCWPCRKPLIEQRTKRDRINAAQTDENQRTLFDYEVA